MTIVSETLQDQIAFNTELPIRFFNDELLEEGETVSSYDASVEIPYVTYSVTELPDS